MTDCFIYDTVRTPRGKGKPGAGALYEVKPIDLVVTLLEALRERLQLDPARVDDLIMGISSAMGDQGSCLPRIAALCGPDGWSQVPGMALQRFCGAGLEAVNMAAEKVRSGWHDLIAAGGVESMSRLGLGASGGAWIYDPATSLKAESGFRLLVTGIRHQRSDRVYGAGAFQQCLPSIAVCCHAADHVIRPRRGRN